MIHFLFAAFVACSLPTSDSLSLDSTSAPVTKLPGKYLSQIQQKSDRMASDMNKRSTQALNDMITQEKKMQAKMMKIDSVAAKNIFSHSIDSLTNLKARLKSKLPFAQGAGGAYLDTLQNSLKFLSGNGAGLGASQDKLSSATASVNNLQDQFQQADQIKSYIRDQQQQLNAQLSRYTSLSGNLKSMNQQAYYYKEQINEYKEALQDKKKAEEKGMELLKKLPAYNQFIQQHSMFASLFNLTGSSSAANLEGLQTRNQVEQLISQRVGSSPSAQAAVSQQMDAARSKFDDLKSKFPDADNAADMPNFKPNPMKNKSFLQRLEFGANVQFQKSTQYFPTTGDFAGQVAYKFNKNGSIGLGVSYKLGMGSGWNNIVFTHQGVGLRSFMDYKLKGTFFINGGFEENYNTTFSHVADLRNWSGWQGSALLGISKKYKISAKLKGNIMVLYDFLASGNVPPTSPVKVRMGYTF
jgi:hypothetical protein